MTTLPQIKHSQTQYITLQNAFDLFNEKLFDNELPQVFLTFQRHTKAFGYYSPNRIEHRKENYSVSEIALNIGTFSARSDKQIFSTLVHEMVHHWQHHFGKLSRNGYHNKEWGNKMKLVGLYPSSTGREGGKETGQKVSHYIMTGGAFEIACNEIEQSGLSINWNSLELSPEKKAKANKVKYTCPSCGANVWGKAELNINCGDCGNEAMISDNQD
jgi:hypothetical protein